MPDHTLGAFDAMKIVKNSFIALVACAVALPACKKGAPKRATPSANRPVMTPTPDAGTNKELKPLNDFVVSFALVGADGSPQANATVLIRDRNYETTSNEKGEFSVPLGDILGKRLPVRITAQADQIAQQEGASATVVVSDIALPADIIERINQVRVYAGQSPLENTPEPAPVPAIPDGSAAAPAIDRKLALQLPQNEVESPDSEEQKRTMAVGSFL